MTADEIIQKANNLATGDDEKISQNDPSYNKWLVVANLLQRDWAEEVQIGAGEKWYSLEEELIVSLSEDQNYVDLPKKSLGLAYSPINYGGVMVVKMADNGEKEVILPMTGIDVRDFLNSGNRSDVFHYDFAKKRINLKPKTAEILRQENHKLAFCHYLEPPKLQSNTETVVMNPNWLVYMLAAEMARNDIIHAGQYGNLIAMAQNLMESMKMAQRRARTLSRGSRYAKAT